MKRERKKYENSNMIVIRTVLMKQTHRKISFRNNWMKPFKTELFHLFDYIFAQFMFIYIVMYIFEMKQHLHNFVFNDSICATKIEARVFFYKGVNLLKKLIKHQETKWGKQLITYNNNVICVNRFDNNGSINFPW